MRHWLPDMRGQPTRTKLENSARFQRVRDASPFLQRRAMLQVRCVQGWRR
jgi:hypothetical protein